MAERDPTRPASGEEAAGATPTKTFAALASADFRMLWIGTLSMMAGLQMQGIVRSFLTYELTSSPLILGAVNAGFAVPMLLLSLFGGVLADRADCKRIIQSFQALGALSALYLAIIVSLGRVTWGHLFAVSVVDGVIFSFMVPARNALIPRIVGTRLVTNAMALNAGGMSATTLLAPAIAGVLYARIGPAGVYFVITALGAASVLATGLIGYRDHAAGGASRPALREIREALAYITRKPLLVELLLIGLFTALLEFPFRAMLPVMIVDVYHRSADSLGLLLSVMGLGAIVGSLGVASLRVGKRGLVLIGGGVVAGIAMGGIALLPLYSVAIAFMVPLGIGDAIRRSLNMALLIEATATSYRGRVASVYTMNFGLMPLGVLPTGAVAELFGIRVATGMLSALLLALCLVMLVFRRETRAMA